MSRRRFSLRLVGELDELEQAAKAMSGLPVTLWRKGVVYPPRVRAQPANVLILELAKGERGPATELDPNDPTLDTSQDPIMAEEIQVVQEATRHLQRLAPVLGALDPHRCRKEIYLFTLRKEDTGGLDLPAELIASAASAGLSMAISISVGVMEDEER